MRSEEVQGVNDRDRQELDRLRAAFAAAADRTTSSSGGCPDAERLWAGARGELSGVELEALVEHSAACVACAREWRLAVDLGAQLPAPAPGPTVDVIPIASFWSVSRLVPALAASLVLVIGGSFLYMNSRAPEFNSIGLPSSDATRDADSGALVVVIEPEGLVTVVPEEFRWEPVADADRYQVRLFTEDGTVVWTSAELTETAAGWPDEVTLESGAFYWQVAALHAGEIIGDSNLTPLQLRP